MMRCSGNYDEKGARKSKTHDEGGEALYVLIVDNLSQACHISKQQPCEDRDERVGQDCGHFSDGLVFHPLRFECGTYQNRGLSCFEGFLRLQSISKIDGAVSGIFYCCDQLISDKLDFLPGRIFGILDMKY